MNRKHMPLSLKILIVLVIVILLSAVFAESLCPYDPYEQNLSVSLQAPSVQHWMGTDQYGRDMLSRVIAGGRISILSALFLVCIVSIAGSTVGILCALKGGILDELMMRICDLFLAFPGMVLALGAAALFHNGIIGAVSALALVGWPKYARLARSLVLREKEKPYIEASRLSGDNAFQIVIRHILPNTAGVLLVTAVLDLGTMMMEIAGLSFLGLGAQPPEAEWGSMMSNGRSMLAGSPWIVLSPGIAMFLCVAVFNLLGDGLRDFISGHNNQNMEAL